MLRDPSRILDFGFTILCHGRLRAVPKLASLSDSLSAQLGSPQGSS
jgi:hypothetical protein